MKKNFPTSRSRGTSIARGVVVPLAFALAFTGLTLAGPRQAAAQAVAVPGASPDNAFTISAAGDIRDASASLGNAADGIAVDGRVGTATAAGDDLTVTVGSGAVIGPANASTITGGAGLTGALTSGTGAGGNVEVRLNSLTTFAGELTLRGGAGGDTETTASGGGARLNDAAAARPSLTAMLDDFTVISGARGVGGPAEAGGAYVDLAGTLRFAGAAPQALDIGRGGTTNGAAGEVQFLVGTLQAQSAAVTMTLGAGGGGTALVYSADRNTAAPTGDWVDIGTLSLINGGSFDAGTNAVGWFAGDEYASAYDGATAYTVKSLHVVGGGTTAANGLNSWTTGGVYQPADTGGSLVFDVTGVAAGDTMLAMNAGTVDFDGFVRRADGYGNANFALTGAKPDQRGLVGRRFTLIDDGVATAGGQWANGGVVRYYSQVGGSRFFYDTYGLGSALMANGVDELTIGKGYSQYQAAVAETAADVFLNNTWAANRHVADLLQPGRFGLTGRLTYFSISQDQDHHSQADKDQLAAALSGGYKFENAAGETTLGAFFEYGHGEYDTDTLLRGWGTGGQGAFGPGSDKIRGDGEADLFGGGLFVYHDFLQGTYLDAGFRFGNADQSFRLMGHGLADWTRIETDANYWGLNLGAGHVLQLTDRAIVDLYGKLMWTRLEDNKFSNRIGERIEMDSVDSIRTRLGARVSQDLTDDGLSLYYGLAWEHEWDGEATGRYDRVHIREAADNSGASGFGEAGLSYTPYGRNFSFEVGAFGLVGAQEGGGGTASLKFEF